MFFKHQTPSQAGLLLFVLLSLITLPGIALALPVFSFSVADLEAYNRIGNWIYDADNVGTFGNPMLYNDGNHFTFSPTTPFAHYYAEMSVHQGIDAGHPTNIVCTYEGTDLADNPGQITLEFGQFDLIAFRRINTVDPTAPWDLPGFSGDKRMYANGVATLKFNGVTKLVMNNAFLCTANPYPNQAQIRALNPMLAAWMGDIGTGLLPTGYGFGDIDLGQSDADWAELFASSNYKVDLEMQNVIAVPSVDKSWFSFLLNIAPAAKQSSYATGVFATIPSMLDFPAQNLKVDLLSGIPGGAGNNLQSFFVREINEEPIGSLPGGLNTIAKKYWQIGTNLSVFNTNIQLFIQNDDFGKNTADWKVLYRIVGTSDWAIWPDYNLYDSGLGMIQANNVNTTYEFTVATPQNIIIVEEGSPLPPGVTYSDGQYTITKTGNWQITLPMPTGFTVPWYISINTVPPTIIEATSDPFTFEWDFGTTKPLFTFTPMDEDPTLPVELTSFAAIVNAQNLISLAWSTASETSMIGYKVYYRPANSNETTICLTPVAIPATNSSNGSNYNYTATELNTPGVYSFYLEAISMDGTSQFYGPVTATLSEIVIPPLPVNNNLGDAWPNPFNTLANTNISVEMKAGESGMVTIYNLAGQAVKSYMVTQGINNLNWNGLDSKGNACASGVYFYKMKADKFVSTKKMILMK